MLAKLFKAFVGDKSAKDIQEVQPIVDRVKELERIDLFEESFLLVQLAQRKCRGLVLKVFNFFLFAGHMVSNTSAKCL